MGRPRPLALVSAPRRARDADIDRRTAVLRAVFERRPEEPLICVRPATLRETARRFVAAFPGDALYAVKCDPEPVVLSALWEGGVRHFDVASIGEVRLVRRLFPRAELHFMHPVKARQAIREAYGRHGVRDFVLDDADELAKILEETGGARDLGLVVRLAVPKAEGTLFDLSGKFGADAATAVELLRAAAATAARVGVSFHVGSQTMDPAIYERALDLAGSVVRASGVEVDVIDVGGGFPVAYPGMTPPPLGDFVAAIARGFARQGFSARTRLWAEPGRALVAEGASIVVQVQKRRGNTLYINDGVYGGLSDAGQFGWVFPARVIRPFGIPPSGDLVGFDFYGPTCDSADHMRGPFLLPADTAVGDWIELGQLGAYGACLRTDFNGFEKPVMIEVSDPPLLEVADSAPREAAA